MANITDITLLYQQMPIAAKLVTAEVVHPELSREVLAYRELQERKRDNSRILETAEKDAMGSVTDEKEPDGEGVFEHHADQQPEEDPGPPPETNPTHVSPWAGNLLNKKI